MTRELAVGVVLLLIGLAWCWALYLRFKRSRSAAVTELIGDTLLGFGFEPLVALGCVFGGCVLIVRFLSGG